MLTTDCRPQQEMLTRELDTICATQVAASTAPTFPAPDAAGRSGGLKSVDARYSSRILHAILARWLHSRAQMLCQWTWYSAWPCGRTY